MSSKELARVILESHACAERYSEAEYQREYGDINEAIKLHKMNTESDVDYFASYVCLAEIYHELNDFENERIILKKCIKNGVDEDIIKDMEFKLKKLEKII